MKGIYPGAGYEGHILILSIVMHVDFAALPEAYQGCARLLAEGMNWSTDCMCLYSAS